MADAEQLMAEEQQVEAILALFDGSTREELLPALEEIQDRLGYLSYTTMERVARHFGVSRAEIYGIVTFYQKFRLTPRGKHQIHVCLGTACHLTGGRLVLEAFCRELGISPGETTADGLYSLEEAACFGCCNVAPVVKIDGEMAIRVSPARVEEVLLNFRNRNEDAV